MQEHRLVKYRGKWAVSFIEDGQRVRRSLGTDDLTEAKRKLPTFLRQAAIPRDISVKTLWDAYREDRAGRRIAENMAFSGKAIIPELGHIRPDDVTVKMCRAYAERRKKQGRSQGTIWTELNHLRIVMSWALKQRLIARPVFIELPSKPAPKDRRLTAAEVRRLLDAAQPHHIKVAIALMATTGARSGAVLDLTWDRVDFERGLVAYALNDGLTRKGRATVPMNRTLRPILLEAKKAAMTDFVVEWAGKKVASIKRGFAASVERAGLSNVTPHIIRHTAASLMAESGRPMSEIASVLGHSDSAITERVYAKYGPTYLRAATDALEFEEVPSGSAEPGAGNKK